MGFIETSYGSSPNLSQVNIDSNLNLGTYGITTDGELNITTGGDLNINDSDLIGVKQFVCKDYLGAVKAEAADILQWTLTLNDVSSGTNSKKFRIPSNFVDNCSVKLSFYAKNTTSIERYLQIRKVVGDSYTTIATIPIPANTSTPTEFNYTLSGINAGEIYYFYPGTMNFLGASGVKIMCDLIPFTSGYWDILD